ncbi:calcium-binding protein [Pseudooceanicola sp. C21-150M6]|uniref:calcium-binding protein n=1 Tax=Pseudooceanicola sp. C21-150M6 TaxID=3434355 RepID=UPI003D7F3D17
MDLSVATHFSHGGKYGERHLADLLELISRSGSEEIRDGLNWCLVETERGTYDFSDFRTSYFDEMAAAGLDVTLTLHPGGNPLYDNGDTVTSARGIAAFARYVDAVLTEFPSIDSIVIGNEFNGLDGQFVTGAAATTDLEQRASYYTDILKAVHDRVADSHSDVQIVGGALHSIATGYVQILVDQGAFEYMDALDIHPYGQDPIEVAQSLAQLNAVLDTLPADQRPDLVVTEFALPAESSDPMANSEYLAKMAAVLAAGGVSAASWYALLDENYNRTADMGLFDTTDTANPVLDSFRFAETLFDTGATPVQMEAGPGVELYDFGNGTWLVWGSAQSVQFSGTGLTFRDASGAVIDRPATLSDAPIYVQGADMVLSADPDHAALLADSFYDFDLTADPDGPWSYFGLKIQNGVERDFDLTVMDGQSRMSESWTPYLGNQWNRPFQMSADVLTPVSFGRRNNDFRATVERFTAEQTGALDIAGSWDVSDDSTDGIRIEIRVNGETIAEQTVTGTAQIALRGVEVAAGDTVDFIVHSGASSTGDNTTRHIRVFEADANLSTSEFMAEHLSNDVISDNETPSFDVYDFRAPVAEARPDAPTFGASEDQLARYAEAANYVDDLNDLRPDEFVSGTVRGAAGGDVLAGDDGRNVLLGLGGDDMFFGGGGTDRLMGRGGDDTLFGDSGNDLLVGGNGDDILIGGSGRDRLRGGEGSDTFVFGPGYEKDIVLDFDAGEGDVLDLTSFDLQFSDLKITEHGNSLLLQAQEDNGVSTIAVLRGVAADDLTESSFLF